MLESRKTIEIQNWMSAPETQAVMQALGNGKALFVGGCVRNVLLGRDVSDIDIATQWPPEEVTVKLQASGIKVIPTGLDHGTVTAIIDGKSFEITTLRKDVETFGRHAVVAFTTDWLEDAQRRDFTMNTLLADDEGHIYDPTGQGLADLEARQVVFVGDPATRIAEDYLRILRFFRFYACYGEGPPDESALAACRDAAEHIGALSKERITQEFLKILAVDKPVDILSLMFDNNVLADIAHESYHPEILGRVSDVIARLIVLSGFETGYLSVLESYLILSNRQKKSFLAILKALEMLGSTSEKSVKLLIYNYGFAVSEQAVLLFLAQRDENDQAAMGLVQSWQIPVFPLSGDDVMQTGLPAGPEVGRILREIERWWMDQDFMPDRDACLGKLKALS